MKSLVKSVAFFLLAGVTILALGLIVLVTLVEPNDYRQHIRQFVKEKTGMVVALNGGISWRFYPVLGFGANDLVVALQEDTSPLIQANDVTIGIKIKPLLSKKLIFDTIHLVGVDAVLIVDENDQNNWTMAELAEAPKAEFDQKSALQAENTFSESFALSLPLINISDSKIHYEDKASDSAYTITVSFLELTDVNLERPFPFTLAARVQNSSGLDIATDITGEITALLKKEIFRVNKFDMKATVGGIFDKVANLNIQGDATLDQKNDSAALKLQKISLASVEAQLTVQATGLSAKPELSGTFQTTEFNAKTLMGELGMPSLETQEPKALTRVSLKTDFFTGNPENTVPSPADIRFHPFHMTLDDSALSGDVAITDIEKQALRFDLQLDSINIDHYLSSHTADTPAASIEVSEELLPVDLLQNLNISGDFNTQELTLKNNLITNLALKISALDGEIQLTQIDASVFQGVLSGTAAIDARRRKPIINTNIQLENIELSDAFKSVLPLSLISGRSNLKLAAKTQGNVTEELLQQALGDIQLNTHNAVIHGISINQIVLQSIREKFGDYSTLLPDYDQKLPKALKGDTLLKNVLMDIQVENGQLLVPPFSTDTSVGTVSAQGRIDLLNQNIDYRFGVVLSALSGNKYFQNVGWPVHCKAALSAPVASWCKPDTKAFSQIFEKAAQQALLDKAANTLGEKLGVKNADEEAIKNTLEEKAKKEEEKAKQKLKEKLESLLNKTTDNS